MDALSCLKENVNNLSCVTELMDMTENLENDREAAESALIREWNKYYENNLIFYKNNTFESIVSKVRFAVIWVMFEHILRYNPNALSRKI